MYTSGVKKPRIAALRQSIRAHQNDLQLHDPDHPTNFLIGWCENNQGFAYRFHGETYTTNAQSSHGSRHTVAVISARGSRRGHVVDVTKEEGIVGVIERPHDEASVIEALAQLFGVGGWQRRK